MRTTTDATPTPLLELARDGWQVTGPLTRQWNPGRRYQAASPDGRTRLRATNYAQHGPFMYDLVTDTSAEYWGLTAPDAEPAAITAAARASLSCGERAPIGTVLIAAGWHAEPVFAHCGTLTEATFTAPDHTTVARLFTKAHTSRVGSGYWLIKHGYGRELSTADTTIPSPVLAGFLLAQPEA